MGTVREFTHEEQEFYSRHLMLPGYGPEMQQRLRMSTVAVIGLGGLGCPAVAQLAASGVGRLLLIDPDKVDNSNLLRQALYFSEDVGKSKASTAARRVGKINGAISVEVIPRAFEPGYLDGCDVVLDCTDNLESREAIARAARQYGSLLVHGAAIGYEGRLAAFESNSSPCLGCLLNENSAPDTCREVGVFAPVTTVIGTMMAAEAIKRIVGFGDVSNGLTVYDGLSGEVHAFEIRPDPNCRICGTVKVERLSVPTISVVDLAQKIRAGDDFVLLDVRELHELTISRIDPCLHIPMSEVLWKSASLSRSADICVLCRTGNRSGTITQALRLRGFTNIRNVAGGINAYAEEIDPNLETY